MSGDALKLRILAACADATGGSAVVRADVLRDAADALEALRARVEKAEATKGLTSDLLAALHGDGGHYEAEHGTARALADAKTAFYRRLSEKDRATYEALQRAEKAEATVERVRGVLDASVFVDIDDLRAAIEGSDR